MARKELDISITAEGRDRNKVFHIREMGAEAAEWWAMRVLLALGKANPNLDYDPSMGMAGIAAAGLRALLNLDPIEAKPLLDEMMACISIKPDPTKPHLVRPLLPEDIEEIATRLQLRSEVFTLHTGFSLPGISPK